MLTKLKILIVEDNQSDADLLKRELKKAGLDFITEIVQTRVSFEHALVSFNPDIILSDYSLPSFDAVTAFRIKQNKNAHIPFIIVSGVIGEENAVELIKDGVTDYVSKAKLFTVSTKINRALSDTAIRNEKNIIDGNLKIQQQELLKSNGLLIQQKAKVKAINLELSKLNLELEERVANRTKALAESEYRFRNMIETIPQIAWTNTIKGKVIFYNQRWYDYTGLNNKQTQLAGFNFVIHPDDLQNSIVSFSAILKTKKGGEFQTRGKGADGLYRWHLVRLMPILDEGGKMHLWIGTATDIEELRILQQQKDDFISIASHELKTPITTLKASLQILDRLKDKSASPTLAKLIVQANKSMEKVNVLIDDLLNASMANNGQLHINRQQFLLTDVITESCQDIRVQAEYNLITIGDLSLKVNADPIRIEQIIVNFVNNAIKYASNSKHITISIEKQGIMAKVSVIDQGAGIAKEKLPYLFDRYFRAEDRETNYNGLGLGLYICAEIIKKHNGKIGVDSAVGKGSTFWFTLPLV